MIKIKFPFNTIISLIHVHLYKKRDNLPLVFNFKSVPIDATKISTLEFSVNFRCSYYM